MHYSIFALGITVAILLGSSVTSTPIPRLSPHLSLYRHNKTFAEADDECKIFGGRLISFSSRDDLNGVLSDVLGMKNYEAGFGGVWDNTRVWLGAKSNGTHFRFADHAQWMSGLCLEADCGEPWVEGFPKMTGSNVGEAKEDNPDDESVPVSLETSPADASSVTPEQCLIVDINESALTRQRYLYHDDCRQNNWFLCKVYV